MRLFDFFKQGANSTLNLLNIFLSQIQGFLLPQLSKDSIEYPPVFIIGPPRSGTTLLYQLLCHRYNFRYFTNFTAWFYGAPIIAFKVENFFWPSGYSRPDYESVHGRTTGWQGPHEAGKFWYRWFPNQEYLYVPESTTSKIILNKLRQEITSITKVARNPLLFKNVNNSMRVAPIIEALPETSFLVCYRYPVDIAQSILKGRIKRFGHKEQWWSLLPREIEQIKQRPYWQQVVDQVYFTYKQIDRDREHFGADYFFDVHYEQLCRNPANTLAGIEKFLEPRGVKLEACGILPTQFSISTGQKISSEDYRLIINRVNELWGSVPKPFNESQ